MRVLRLVLPATLSLLFAVAAVGADNAPGAVAIKALLTKHKKWAMYYDITKSPLPSERAHKITWEFFERDQKLMARLVVEFGGCEFEVPLRPDGINMRWCILQGETSPKFDPSDAKYPLKDSDNPRKLWLTPAN
jgi:hypothetical protein